MHWTDCSLTMPRLLMPVKNGSVSWELTHWNHIWWLLCSVSRKQLLITTSSQICYIRIHTKENSCLKLKKLHDSCSWSFFQSIQKLLHICVHSPLVQTHFQLHFHHPHVLIKCRLFRGGHLCQTAKCKVSPPLISTALKLLHLPSSSAAIEWVYSNFGLVQSKVRNQLDLEKAAKLVTCYRQLRGNTELNWIGNWNEHWNGPGRTDYEIFRR